MNATEIDNWLQDALMTPEYSDIGITTSCTFWLLETIANRYEK